MTFPPRASWLLCAPLLLLPSACAYRQARYPGTPAPPVVVTSEDRNLGIPDGQLPPPGECRIWFPGRPPGQQPPPSRCGAAVPVGAWLLSRPDDRSLVRVQEFDAVRAGVITAVKIYEAATGRFLRRE